MSVNKCMSFSLSETKHTQHKYIYIYIYNKIYIHINNIPGFRNYITQTRTFGGRGACFAFRRILHGRAYVGFRPVMHHKTFIYSHPSNRVF